MMTMMMMIRCRWRLSRQYAYLSLIQV